MLDKNYFICVCSTVLELLKSDETECPECKRRYWQLKDESKGTMALLIWEDPEAESEEEIKIKTFIKKC